MEGLWARSSESLVAHANTTSLTVRAHVRYLSGTIDLKKLETSQLVQSHITYLSESIVAQEQVLRKALSEGLIANMSEGLFARQRTLAKGLRESLTLKLKIFIIMFIFVGTTHYNQVETSGIALYFFLTALGAYVLHSMTSASAAPLLFFKQSEWMSGLLEQCPSLLQSYKPPVLWGWNGHIQTFILGKIGRSINPALPMKRSSFTLPDGSTIFYDTFTPPFSKVRATLIAIPGIANTSEKLYIKTFVKAALRAGLRVVVLNHVGALANTPITTPRIFGYGHTDDTAALVNIINRKYKEPKILVGFSMGGNIAAKYLTEVPERQEQFAGLVTICQGYDILRSSSYLLSYGRMARLYNWAVTNGALKATINKHSKILFEKYDQTKITNATCLQDIDSELMCKMYNFADLEEMYEKWSCSNYLDNLNIPAMFVNATDDPMIAPDVIDVPIRIARTKDKVVHVQTQCGGHLGFFTGGWLIPSGFSWIDTLLVEYANAVLTLDKKNVDDD